MATKLTFKIERERFGGTPEEISRNITNGINRKLNDLSIETLNTYKPSHNSIKVLFPNENQANKALDKYTELKNAGYEPRIPIPLKTARTVYCYALDPSLLSTYSTPEILKSHLLSDGWKARDIVIMNSKKSFKIIMETTSEARKFIASNSTRIGGIQIKKESKEIEINPIVDQCWTCGTLNPNHNGNSCPNTKKCLKCNSREHAFFRCPLPKNSSDMTPEQRAARYCVPCGSTGNHTSLDHRYCPQKRSIVQNRIKLAREERARNEAANERDSNLIKKTLELSNTDAWPALRENQEQNQKNASIVLLALLDDSKQPGIFQHKFSQALHNNGLPDVKYTPEPGTSEKVMQTLCAANMKLQTMSSFSTTPGPSGIQISHSSKQPTVRTKLIKPTEVTPKRPLISSNDLNSSIIVNEHKKTKSANPGQDLPTPDSMQAIVRLREEIKSAPIPLNENM